MALGLDLFAFTHVFARLIDSHKFTVRPYGHRSLPAGRRNRSGVPGDNLATAGAGPRPDGRPCPRAEAGPRRSSWLLAEPRRRQWTPLPSCPGGRPPRFSRHSSAPFPCRDGICPTSRRSYPNLISNAHHLWTSLAAIGPRRGTAGWWLGLPRHSSFALTRVRVGMSCSMLV